ncbi:WD40-repeat-containing domain protein [Cunninghamella echinulata]|nr:WD40-repeat-containing domain protein [Cunninghamella echinulata]
MLTTRKRRYSDTLPGLTSEKEIELKKKDSNENLTTEQREEKQEKIFKNLRLRRIVKENHGENITQLAFFFNNKNFTGPVGIDVHKTFDKKGSVQREESDTSNVLATVGGCQVNIYDNEHCGDHLDIMSNFNMASKFTEDQDKSEKSLQTACWLYKNEDAWIATGGADCKIHIFSLAYSREVIILKGHSKRILDIQSHPLNDRYIISVSSDDSVRLWDVDNKRCLAVFEADATVACFHPSGESFITGNSKGDFRLWSIPESVLLLEDDEPLEITKANSQLLKKMHGDCAIGKLIYYYYYYYYYIKYY